MENVQRELTMSVAEFCLIAGVVGGNNLIGIDDPWPNFSPEQVQRELGIARSGLAERGLIEIRADNRILVEPWAAAVVSTCAFPEVVCIITHSLPDLGQAQRYCYLTRSMSVEMAGRPDSGLRLLVYEEQRAIFDRIIATFRLGNQEAQRLPGGQIPQRLMSELARTAAQKGEEAVKAELAQFGASPEVAAALASTFAHPLQSGSLTVMAPVGQQWQVDGFGLLEGANALWRMTPRLEAGEQVVALEPTSAADARTAVSRLIGQYLPGAVA